MSYWNYYMDMEQMRTWYEYDIPELRDVNRELKEDRGTVPEKVMSKQRVSSVP